jgi:hypothetical protein
MNSKPSLRRSANTWTTTQWVDKRSVYFYRGRTLRPKNGCPTLRDFRSVGTTNADIVFEFLLLLADDTRIVLGQLQASLMLLCVASGITETCIWIRDSGVRGWSG